MVAQVQHRRGASAVIAGLTPANGEIWVDTDKKALVVGDGVTAGGKTLSAPIFGGTSGGSANAQTLTPSPAVTTLYAGLKFYFIAGYTSSTTTPTLAPSGLTAKTITRENAQPLYAGDIVAGGMYAVVYDGTQYVLLNPSKLVTSATSLIATPTADQTINASAWSTLTLDSVSGVNTGGFNTGTSVFTSPITGTYFIGARAMWPSAEADKGYALRVMNAGAVVMYSDLGAPIAGAHVSAVSGIIQLTAGNTISVQVLHGSTGARDINGNEGAAYTSLAIQRLI